MEKFGSRVEYLAQTVKNPNIIISGTKSYYSNAWTTNFEDYVVRYLYGDEHSLKNWTLQWKLDKLYIGNYVCIGAEAVILLDWMLPEMSGLEICKIIRNNPELKNIPIIMLTAKSQKEDKVVGLSAGADDYVTKPFSMLELLARIKTNLRRVSTTSQPTKKEYVFQDIRLDTIEKKVFRGENYVRLGPTEFRILKLLIANPRHVFSREDLLKEVWGNSVYVEMRTVDVHIRRLRKALNEFGADYIRTIRATGYSIDDHEAETEDTSKN